MRITGGKARGIQLKAPRGVKTRPAADVIREALFSSLGSRVDGQSFLDLFAGTGAYGLEAWSRGARGGLFVEKGKDSIICLTENIRRVGKSAQLDESLVSGKRADVFRWRVPSTEEFDLVFADPPYGLYPEVPIDLFRIANALVHANGLFILEKPARLAISSPGWVRVNEVGKSKGDGPSIAIFQRSSVAKADS